MSSCTLRASRAPGTSSITQLKLGTRSQSLGATGKAATEAGTIRRMVAEEVPEAEG